MKQFKQSFNIVINVFLRNIYSLRDAAVKQESREFVKKMLRSAKNVDITEIKSQFDFIYNNIDLDLRMHILRPIEKSTMNDFLFILNDRKYD